MNIFQKRHRIIEKHRGERFTPAQLRAEFLNMFPDVNPSSINAADCFNTPNKKAGCTCNECTKLEGFAVNRDGIVDMGASGWSEISSVYMPTGRTRSSLPLRTTLLHVIYPDVIPIFDQMVLKAVGSWSTAANQDIAVLGRYIPHAWALADRHTAHLTAQETPLRLIDMGLWLVRNLGY